MKHKKILPKHHTGKVVHHRHTAYGLLALILILTALPLVVVSQGIVRAAPTDPVSSDYATYAVVPGQIPEPAPEITNIPAGSTFENADFVTVSGNCPDKTLVKLYKNDVFAGATFCEAGRFSLEIDLFFGTNTLIARAYNSNNMMGPQSTPVVVERAVAGVSTTNANPDANLVGQFFITSDIYYKGINIGDEIVWPITLSGGHAPYAVSISWGDGKTDLISRAQAGTFEVKHRYEKGGQGSLDAQNVTILATDEKGNRSFIQMATIVNNSEKNLVGNIQAGYNWSQTLRIAWQLLALAILIVFSFWLGERREAFVLKRRAGSL